MGLLGFQVWTWMKLFRLRESQTFYQSFVKNFNSLETMKPRNFRQNGLNSCKTRCIEILKVLWGYGRIKLPDKKVKILSLSINCNNFPSERKKILMRMEKYRACMWRQIMNNLCYKLLSMMINFKNVSTVNEVFWGLQRILKKL